MEIIDPEHLLTMEPSTYAGYLEQLRARRALLSRRMGRIVDRRNRLSKGELYHKLDNAVKRMHSAIIKVDKALDTLDKYVNAAMALRLQYGDVDFDTLSQERAEDEPEQDTVDDQVE